MNNNQKSKRKTSSSYVVSSMPLLSYSNRTSLSKINNTPVYQSSQLLKNRLFISGCEQSPNNTSANTVSSKKRKRKISK